MGRITIKKARKILGKMAETLTDEQIEKDIHTAEILKSIFFDQYLKGNNRK